MTSNEVPAIKAFLFNTRVGIAKKLAGVDAFNQALSAMSEGTRRRVLEPLPATDWVELEHNHDFLLRMLEIGYGGNLAKVTEQGRATQTAGARSIYKIFLRFLDTAHIVERGPAYYKQAYIHNGAIVVERFTDCAVRVHYQNIKMPSLPFYEHQRGGLMAICELTRCKSFDVDYASGGGSSPNCSIDISWKI